MSKPTNYTAGQDLISGIFLYFPTAVKTREKVGHLNPTEGNRVT